MELSIIIPHIEALVFASEKPLTSLDLVELVNNALGFIENRATLDQVESAVEAIKEKYQSEFYPFEFKESGGGLQYLTKPAYHKTVAQLNGDKFLKRLSSAALETLAIIAYKQPITKGEIEGLRGVNCDYAVQKLLEKDLVLITGRKESAPGQPLIYGTSKTFMDYFGINSPQELPKLSDVIPQDIAESTTITGANPVDGDLLADDNTMVTDENGNLEEIMAQSDMFNDMVIITEDIEQLETADQIADEPILTDTDYTDDRKPEESFATDETGNAGLNDEEADTLDEKPEDEEPEDEKPANDDEPAQ